MSGLIKVGIAGAYEELYKDYAIFEGV